MAGSIQYKIGAGIRLGTWTLSEKGLEICDELVKRNVDLCCFQEVGWSGCGARLIGLLGRRYIMWWSQN